MSNKINKVILDYNPKYKKYHRFHTEIDRLERWWQMMIEREMTNDR